MVFILKKLNKINFFWTKDYEEEMKKSSNSRNFTEWNLINTGRALLKKFSDNAETAANVFVFRADYFHLRSFAKYDSISRYINIKK